jgi:hypothetical protein
MRFSLFFDQPRSSTMIRYSSYGATNFRSTSAQTYLDPLEVQYRELLELRERVREAEAAAQRKGRASSRELNPTHAQYCQDAA